MFIPNIPRRKIYETMLELEDILLDMNILLYNQDNFNKLKSNFNQKIPNMKHLYNQINSLLILFLENKQYQKEEDYQKDLDYFMQNLKETNQLIKKDKNLKKEFKAIIEHLNKELLNLKEVTNFENTKILFKDLDIYNTLIPKTLELRRDKMKWNKPENKIIIQ